MTIKEVSEKFDLTTDTLRYYEKAGLIPKVNRKGKNRDYNKQDIRWVEFIKCMRQAGLSIDILHEYVMLFEQGNTTTLKRKQLLEEQRKILSNKIVEMKTTLKKLDYKIDNYDAILKDKEKKLKDSIK